VNEAAEVFDFEEFREGFRLLAEMTGEPRPRKRRVVRRRGLAEVVHLDEFRARKAARASRRQNG
jgi:hypothetical protein